MKSVKKGASRPEYEFPKLMEGSEGLIVLMKERGYGTVVNDPQGFHRIGTYSVDWAMSFFTDFNGTIELSNDE